LFVDISSASTPMFVRNSLNDSDERNGNHHPTHS
jgi:hypothetical protein